MVNQRLVAALSSCQSFLGIDLSCSGGAQTTTTAVGTAIPASATAPRTTITASAAVLPEGAAAGCDCCGQDACVCSSVVGACHGAPKVKVEVTKHHEVHMYESRWKKLFFSLLKTVKEDTKGKKEKPSDPDIEEAVSFHNFLHKNDMKTEIDQVHETRGLRTRLEGAFSRFWNYAVPALLGC
jgi:hypothetical protein